MKILIFLVMLFFQPKLYASNCEKTFFRKEIPALVEEGQLQVLKEVKLKVLGDGKPLDLSEVEKKAREGDALSQLQWGLIFIRGDKVPQDYKEAYHWIKKSAEQDFLPARAQLGLMYAHGIGVPKNGEKAFRILAGLYPHKNFKKSFSK